MPSPQLAPGIRYVDAHCHVDLFPDPVEVMREASRERVAVVAVTNAPSVFQPLVRLASAFENVLPALGLHPELAVERESELSLFRKLLEETDFVGEIGLDGTSRSPRGLATQRRVLGEILHAIERSGPKVLMLHTRRAVRATFDTFGDARASVILHWFNGTDAQARAAVDRGWWFSVNPAMLGSPKGRALVRSLPCDRVLTESDGPFANVKNRPSRPTDVSRIVEDLASLWELGHEDARWVILENFRRCSDLRSR